MSTFGSESVGVAIVFGCAVAVPVFGWYPLIGAVIIVCGWAVLVTDANRNFNPDGSRKPQPRRKHGRDKRDGGRSSGVAGH